MNPLAFLGYKPPEDFATRRDFLHNAVPVMRRQLGMYRYMVLRMADDYYFEDIEEAALRDDAMDDNRLPNHPMVEVQLQSLYVSMAAESQVWEDAWEGILQSNPLLIFVAVKKCLDDYSNYIVWSETPQWIRDAIAYCTGVMSALANGANQHPKSKEAREVLDVLTQVQRNQQRHMQSLSTPRS